MKLGIIGAGKIVQEFLPSLKAIPEIEVLGILAAHQPRAQALCDRYGIPTAARTFEELAGCGIDTVYAAVPNSLHYDYCRRALEAGLHVITEKPITAHSRQAEALAALARERGLLLFEAITTLYLPAYEKIREWLPEIGEVRMVQSQFNQYSSRYEAFAAGQLPPVFDPAQAGGALMDMNLYNVFYVMGLFGSPDSARYLPNLQRGVDTCGLLTLHYPGFDALCVASKDNKGPCFGSIQGTRGVITTHLAPNAVGSVTLERYDGTVRRFEPSSAHSRCVPEFTAFARAIQQHDTAFCYERLALSVAVCRVMTQARTEAGIHFPCDDENL